MDIGSAIAVFLVLSILLMALFCFITRYFHNKLKQNIEEANQIYSVVDDLNDHNNSQQYASARQLKNILKNDQKNEKIKQDKVIEMKNLRPMLQDDLFGTSSLRKRLNADAIPVMQQTGRSLNSIKSFRPQKMMPSSNTARTSKLQEKQNKQDITIHRYVNKVVCYDSTGLTRIQVKLETITKLGVGMIKQKKQAHSSFLSESSKNIQTQIQLQGFQLGEFGFYKYMTTIQIVNMKQKEQYNVRGQKAKQQKQSIDIGEYLQLKMEIIGK